MVLRVYHPPMVLRNTPEESDGAKTIGDLTGFWEVLGRFIPVILTVSHCYSGLNLTETRLKPGGKPPRVLKSVNSCYSGLFPPCALLLPVAGLTRV